MGASYCSVRVHRMSRRDRIGRNSMSAPQVCPHCGSQVHLGQAVERGTMIRCTSCGEHFLLGGTCSDATNDEPRRRLPAEALVAGGIALVIGAAMAGAFFIAGSESSVKEPIAPAVTAADAERQRLDDERRALAESQKPLERDQQR